jgi:hypothetical protein
MHNKGMKRLLLAAIILTGSAFGQWSEPITRGTVKLSHYRYELNRTSFMRVALTTTSEETDAFVVTLKFDSHGKQQRSYTAMRAKCPSPSLFVVPTVIDVPMNAPVYAITVKEVVFKTGDDIGFEIEDSFGVTDH